MLDDEKINIAIKNEWMKWLYDIYKKTFYQCYGNYCGCLSYKDWISIRIDLYNP